MASSDYSHTLLLGTRCSERVTAVAQSGKTTSHTGLGVPLAKCLSETFVTRDFLLKYMNWYDFCGLFAPCLIFYFNLISKII